MDDNSSSSEFQTRSANWVRRDPKHLAQQFLANFDIWKSSRNWAAIAVGIVPLLVLVAVFGMAFWGNTFAASTLMGQYIEAAEEAAPVKADGTGADAEFAAENEVKTVANDQIAKERKELSDYAFMLYQRVLENEANNKRARYYVAAQMAQRGDLVNARIMMDSLAPSGTEGYAPAHAWKAYDSLRTAAMTQRQPDQKSLDHDLEMASQWGGTSPQLLMQRGRMLEAEGKINQALAMYSNAADRDPNYRLLLADAYRRHGQPTRTQAAIDSVINFYSRNFDTPDEETEDRIKVAQAYLFNNDVEKAINVLGQGLAKRDNKDEYQRAISQVFRTAYLSSIQLDEKNFKANLVLLDRAIETDPVNPALQADVAKLTELLIRSNAIDAGIKLLNDQLAAGSAPILSHLLLANLHYFNKSIENANLHWELVLDINPKVVIALRSYALSLATKPEPDLTKALELIERACELSSGSVDALDAKGDILKLSGRMEDAVKVYEEVVRKAPVVTLATRKKLIALYTDLNRNEDAERELKILDLIEKRIEQIKAAQTASQNANQNNANQSILGEVKVEEKKDDGKNVDEKAAEKPKAPEDESLDDLIRGLQQTSEKTK